MRPPRFTDHPFNLAVARQLISALVLVVTGGALPPCHRPGAGFMTARETGTR
jgi:hypothetical protein